MVIQRKLEENKTIDEKEKLIRMQANQEKADKSNSKSKGSIGKDGDENTGNTT